ncbi:MAG: glycosyl transferase family 2 [Chloroflexi bacterium]|nr:glycosyl transferase family 2 [Chloroflexota bacterium]
MSPLKFAVYAVALDDASRCEAFYRSCADADLVLVADAGSTDGTADLLRQLGASVQAIAVEPWRFDTARNTALSLVPRDVDVCIPLDLDQELSPGWREALEAAWTPGTTRGQVDTVWSWLPDGSPGTTVPTDRIHARRHYRWLHPSHEVLSYYAMSGVDVERMVDVPGMRIFHRPGRQSSRVQAFYLLSLAVREDPGSSRAAFYYGRELCYQGMWDNAIAELERYLGLWSAVWAEERSEAMLLLARCHAAGERQADRMSWVLRAIAQCPSRREGWCELAQLHYEQQQWVQCLAACQEALRIPERSRAFINDERAWGPYLDDLAAISAYNLGLYEDAMRHGRLALALDPGDGRLRTNLEFYEAKASRALVGAG